MSAVRIQRASAAEAEALYDLLERQVVPEFHARDEQGIPTAWVARMRESMTRLTPLLAASRAIRDYTAQHYIWAAETYRARAAEKGAQRIVSPSPANPCQAKCGRASHAVLLHRDGIAVPLEAAHSLWQQDDW